MTKRVRCVSCYGVYVPDQPGGYYHACPPHRLVAKGPGGPNIVAGDPGPYDEVTKIPQCELVKEPRDENLDDRDPEKPLRPKRQGRGCERVE